MDNICQEFLTIGEMCQYILTGILPTVASPPLIISITGFPTLGKTTISNHIAGLFGPPHTLILQAESWILPYQQRKKMGISGSSPKAYNVEKCVQDIQNLLRGNIISLSTYSHLTGTLTEKTCEVNIHDKLLLILDGTLFSIPDFSKYASRIFFLVPEDPHTWYPYAINRDVKQRYFSIQEAQNHNKFKYNDMLRVLNISLKKITHTIITRITQEHACSHIYYNILEGPATKVNNKLLFEVLI